MCGAGLALGVVPLEDETALALGARSTVCRAGPTRGGVYNVTWINVTVVRHAQRR